MPANIALLRLICNHLVTTSGHRKMPTTTRQMLEKPRSADYQRIGHREELPARDVKGRPEYPASELSSPYAPQLIGTTVDRSIGRVSSVRALAQSCCPQWSENRRRMLAATRS